jgi:hypothetical protein
VIVLRVASCFARASLALSGEKDIAHMAGFSPQKVELFKVFCRTHDLG